MKQCISNCGEVSAPVRKMWARLNKCKIPIANQEMYLNKIGLAMNKFITVYKIDILLFTGIGKSKETAIRI